MKLIAICLLTILNTTVGFSQDWKLEKDKDDIKVYTSESSDFRMKASRAEMILTGISLEKVVSAVYTVEKYKDWMADISNTKILKRKSSSNLIYYSEHNAPWPASDRDIVVEILKKTEKDKVTLNLINRPNFTPEKDNIVRIPIYEGKWTFIKTSNGIKVELEYQTDPGGNVPDWMIQGAAVKTPYNMFEALRNYLKQQ